MYRNEFGVRIIVWFLAGMTVLLIVMSLVVPVGAQEAAPPDQPETVCSADRVDAGNRVLLQRIFDGFGTVLIILSVTLTVAAFHSQNGC